MNSARQTPNKPNRILDYVHNLWPVVVAISCFVFFLGGRLEDAQTRTNRIRDYFQPLEDRIEKVENRLDTHRSSPGHAVMGSRMDALEAEVRRMHKDCESNDESVD